MNTFGNLEWSYSEWKRRAEALESRCRELEKQLARQERLVWDAEQSRDRIQKECDSWMRAARMLEDHVASCENCEAYRNELDLIRAERDQLQHTLNALPGELR